VARRRREGPPEAAAIRTRADFDRGLKAAGDQQLVVINFGASWCGECRKFAPFVGQLVSQFASESPMRVRFFKIDVDQSDELVNSLKPSALPCFLFFVSGKKVDTLVGAQQTVLRKKVVKHAKGIAGI
jgi:thioredoxin-like negative regulator of GroEL